MSDKKDYIYSEQLKMFGKREIIGFGSDEFCVKEIEKSLSNRMIIDNHYSHKVAGFATTYIFRSLY